MRPLTRKEKDKLKEACTALEETLRLLNLEPLTLGDIHKATLKTSTAYNKIYQVGRSLYE